MDDLYELKNRIREYMKTVSDVGEALGVEDLKKRCAELAAERETEGFWTDTDRVAAVNREIKSAERKIGRHSELETAVRDLKELADLCEEGNESEAEELRGEIEALSARIDEVRLEALLKGRYDGLNAIITLHAGAGGTEAQDWTRMLYRMYSRYLERKGFTSRVVDVLEGEEAGLKSVTFTADGENAYGYLKAEKGIHRLVRISPFDSSKRRHTSFASVEVMPEIVNDSEIEIRPEDLKVDTYRSSGAGGQHVNKTESAVRITHLPTGIIVACQNERSQIQNREFAMRMLKSKLAEKREAEQMAEAASIKGNLKKIEWGSQIRSYVFCPYTMVKDHRTNHETADVQGVMDGDIEEFIVEYLKRA